MNPAFLSLAEHLEPLSFALKGTHAGFAKVEAKSAGQQPLWVVAAKSRARGGDAVGVGAEGWGNGNRETCT